MSLAREWAGQPDPYAASALASHTDRLVRIQARMEEEGITREVIRILQTKGYVVREAEDFQATLQAERERVYDAYTQLICEDVCRCIQCLREAVEATP